MFIFDDGAIVCLQRLTKTNREILNKGRNSVFEKMCESELTPCIPSYTEVKHVEGKLLKLSCKHTHTHTHTHTHKLILILRRHFLFETNIIHVFVHNKQENKITIYLLIFS